MDTDIQRIQSTDAPHAVTLPGRLAHWADVAPRDIAVREKSLGRWVETTWAELARSVAVAAGQLAGAGVRSGDHVLLLGQNRLHWVRWMLAAQSVGAVPTAVDPRASGATLTHAVDAVAPVAAIGDGLAEAEDCLALWRGGHHGLRLVVINEDTTGLADPIDTVSVRTADELLAESPDGVPAHAAAADDRALVLWTSGTTGTPRGVPFTWRQIAAMAHVIDDAHQVRSGDDVVLGVSMAHVIGFGFGVLGAIWGGATLNFPESPDTLRHDLRVLRPTVFVATGRFFEGLQSDITARAASATPLKRLWFRTWFRAARPAAGAHRSGRARRAVVGLAFTRSLHRFTGFGWARLVVSTGSPVTDRVVTDLARCGVELTRVYSVTEAGGPLLHSTRLDASEAGEPYPGVVVRLRDGALRVTAPAMAAAYVDGSPALDDGWLATGDHGELRPGSGLALTDLNLGPAEPRGALERESALRALDLVGRAVVSFQHHRWLALIEPDEYAAMAWARRHGRPVATMAELYRDQAIEAAIRTSVEALTMSKASGAPVGGGAVIDDFRCLPRPLSEDRGELTPDGKVRRAVVIETNEELIGAMSPTKAEESVR